MFFKFNYAVASFTLVGCLLMASCQTSQDKSGKAVSSEKKVTSDNKTDASPKKVTQVYQLQTSESKVRWERKKILLDVEETVKLGKGTMQVKMDSLQTSSDGDLAFAEGSTWILADKNFEKAVLNIDLTQIKSLRLNNQNKIDEGSPEYLDVERFPQAQLTIEQLTPTQQINQFQAKGTLTLKGKTLPIGFVLQLQSDEAAQSLQVTAKIPFNGKEWGLANPKVGKVAKDDFVFDLNLLWKMTE